jgi:signal transduction histidine kinase
MFNVQAGSLLMLDEDAQELEFVASQLGDKDPPRGLRMRADKGIAGHVALTQQPMIVNDAYNLSEFSREVDQVTGFVTRSILCVPLMVQNRCIGVLELLNKRGSAFTQEDLERLRNVAGSVAIALENARLFREAQELNEGKSRFMAVLAKELRLPLTAIKGYSGMVLSEVQQPHGDISESIARIEDSTEYLIDLMEDLLDITRLETGETQLDLQPVSVRQIVTQIAAAFKQRLKERSLRLTAKVPGQLPAVLVDQERISQVLKSLLTNAYLYTLPKGRLTIGAQRQEHGPGRKDDGDWIVVSVSDTGIGIAPEDQPKVFERFFRAEHPVVQHHQGRGLSLSIAKSLVELHGGRLWFESEPGKGSTFYLTLPVVG